MRKNKFGLLKMVAFMALFIVITALPSFAEKLRMCVYSWPTLEIFRGMAGLNQLDRFTLRYEDFQNCTYGIGHGKYDISSMTLFEFIPSQRESSKNVVIAAIDHSIGGDGIVLRPEIKSASKLRGKTIGLQTDSLSLHLLHMYLKKNNLSLNDINIVNINVEYVGKAFVSNRSLSGIVGWHPHMNEAIAAGGKLVVTTKDFPETIFALIVVDRESLKNNRTAYKEFLKKWFEAVHQPSVFEKTAQRLKISVQELRTMLSDAHIYPDAESALRSFPKMKQVTQEMQALFKTMPASIKGKAKRLFGHKPMDIEPFFDDSLLKEIKEQ